METVRGKVIYMKNLKNIIMGITNFAALVLTIQSVNGACIWHFHQPEIPESAKKLIKYKRYDR